GMSSRPLRACPDLANVAGQTLANRSGEHPTGRGLHGGAPTLPRCVAIAANSARPSRLRSARRCRSPPLHRLDAEDRRQMPRNLLPALAFVGAGEDRTAVGPEVEADRLALVTRHRLPQHREV